jgi:TonB family protein
MMTKKRSRSLANLKILIVLPVLALLLMFFSTCSEKISTNETVVTEVTPPSTAPAISMDPNEPFVVVEEMPLFPGGDTALLQYIASNTKYPGEAVKNNITGRVIVRFCITATGSIDRVSVIRGVDPLLDAEAIRVVSVLPPFQPGKQGGKPVPVWYMVPITFALGGEKDSSIPPPPPPPPPAPSGSAPYVTGAAKGENDTYVMVEEMPEYPGGNEEMLKFIATNVRYPEAAKKAGITGKVIIRFKVTETGEVKEPSIFKGVEPSIDAEALRVVSLLPPFKPGTQGGKNVSVWIMVPITFSLK